MASIIASLPPPLAAHGRNNTFFSALPKLPFSSIRERQNRASVVVKATGESSESSNSLSIVKSVQNVVSSFPLCSCNHIFFMSGLCLFNQKSIVWQNQIMWDNSEDRPGLVGLGFAAIVAFWASSNLITWFIYRYLLFKPDREELFQIVNKSISDILGQ
ncbi:protein CURVATURE THYLAKOID 1C, chloroplastic isoform X2 [Prunus dulcis]|uniref:protein CURVATURE THYLAKOID 1C, chloroplastic isoform X2 n=1 Tax=Prunus dulcis TaxID=3755 RepID=UPI00148262E1|nr:protein CURVATURE THYLAKOID 1C, chloroplastic isoform X2 [Prunus dulcis]